MTIPAGFGGRRPARRLGWAGIIAPWAAAVVVAASTALAADLPAVPTDAETAIHGTFNNGEDVTRPRNQVQVRQRYTRLPDAGDLKPEKWTTTLRADLWTGLAGGWKLYGRVDQPLVYANDVTSRFNPDGHGRFGQGDLLTELAIIPPPPTPRVGYGVGIRAVWPTAGLNEAGSGKCQVGPVVGVRYSLPEISPGTFVLPELFYLNSIASRNQNSSRSDFNQLNLKPKMNVALPEDWFVTAYASEEIQVNVSNGGKWFIPLDVMVGKKLFDTFVASIEYSQSVFHASDFEPYRWQLEGRLGYYF